jgi:thiamine-phosphate pyrophosphorylase
LTEQTAKQQESVSEPVAQACCMKPLEQCRLYTFIDTAFLRGRAAAAVAEDLCRGGSDLIQLRAKDCSPEQVRQLAGEILPVLRRAGVGLVINDHWNIARKMGADFCHLGQEDFFGAGLAPVPRLSARPPRPLLGLSTHAPEQAARALAAGPAYIAIGPVYATGTKPGARPVTLEYVRWAAANVKIPWFAIGGIHPGNLEEVLQAGAERICVVSAILNAPDIAQACREFKKRLQAGQPSLPIAPLN